MAWRCAVPPLSLPVSSHPESPFPHNLPFETVFDNLLHDFRRQIAVRPDPDQAANSLSRNGSSANACKASQRAGRTAKDFPDFFAPGHLHPDAVSFIMTFVLRGVAQFWLECLLGVQEVARSSRVTPTTDRKRVSGFRLKPASFHCRLMQNLPHGGQGISSRRLPCHGEFRWPHHPAGDTMGLRCDGLHTLGRTRRATHACIRRCGRCP